MMSPTHTDEPRESQFGKFRLLRKIATGGMGEIFLARHVDLPENTPPVALKRILPHYSQDPRYMRMFLAEAKITARLKHKNLVKVIDFGKEKDAFYMTLEYVEGESLLTLWEKARRFPDHWSLGAAVEIVLQALDGIAHAHGLKDKGGKTTPIVHLDLNPRNLMVTPKGEVKILDFGISRALYQDNQKEFKNLCGTYAYLSPEQAREERVDPRSDLFTLGVVLYELGVGRPLFHREGGEAMILKAICDGVIPPPSNAVKDFPADLERVILKSLSGHPKERYHDADEFARALRHAAETYRIPLGPKVLADAILVLNAATEEAAKVEKKKRETAALPPAAGTEEKPVATKPEPPPVAPAPGPSPVPVAPARTPDPPRTSPASSLEDPEEAALRTSQRVRWVMTGGSALILATVLLMIWLGVQKSDWIEPTRGSTVFVPTEGTIKVETEPEGAKIWLDGEAWPHPTPVDLTHLPLNKKIVVEVSMPGFRKEKQTFLLTSTSPLDGMSVLLRRE